MRPDADAPKNDYPGRDPPRRYIDKKEGVRHVLHAAIRSVLNEEDPFAIHLLCQSAEKVLIDLLKNQGSDDPFSIIPAEKRNEWYDVHRETWQSWRVRHCCVQRYADIGLHPPLWLAVWRLYPAHGILYDFYWSALPSNG